MICHSNVLVMIAFLIVFVLVTIISVVVTIYNIADGLRKAKRELDRGVSIDLDNSEYDYGHNVKYK